MPTTYLIAQRRRAARTLSLLGAVVARISRAIERRRAVTALSHLSDHQLRDIGISRTEIDHVVDRGRFQ
ncbi:DUF1127 domain-containing protein [Dongia sp.]|uniref:DUF1127 domain-containing protein n=1 Tax=Dongia sp. TaxID=1977262 RepID=UPI0035B2C810